jgi:hypothetical protein
MIAITFYSNPFCVPAGSKQVLSHEGLHLLLIIWYSISSQLRTHLASTTEIPEEQWKGYDITPMFHRRDQENWPISKYKVTRNAWLQIFQFSFLDHGLLDYDIRCHRKLPTFLWNPVTSIFYPENGGNRFLQYSGNHLLITKCHYAEDHN